MAMNFKARVLLELGAELISSDTIAIYELVKNALDAGSKKIEVAIDIALQHSDYMQLSEFLYQLSRDEEGSAEFDCDRFNQAVIEQLDDSVSEKARGIFLKTYGEPRDLTQAKDRLDEAYKVASRIVVRDYGSGMSKKELNECYLTVGTPSRLLQKNDAIEKAADKQSRLRFVRSNQTLPLGEKGIGRLSAMRLGHLVRVRTKRANSRVWNLLELDWRSAFIDPHMDASALDFLPTQKKCSEDEFEQQGTSIDIRYLQSNWKDDKIKDLADLHLAKLADPFASLRPNKFITFTYQGRPIKIPYLDREPLDMADAVCEARLEYGDDYEPKLVMHINYKRYSRETSATLEGEHLRACVREDPTSKGRKRTRDILVDAEIIAKAIGHLGPWDMKFYWFNRGRVQKEQSDIYNNFLKPFLNKWSGGFLVYRDGYRVYPYGERSDDWLDLDQKALAAKSYKLNRAQIVGYLRLSSIANPMLVDQTNREGFRDSYDKEALRRLLRYVILGFTRPFIEEVDRKAVPALEDVVAEVEGKISTSKVVAVSSLREMQNRLPDETKNIAKVMHHLEEVSDAWERAKLRITNFEHEMEKFIHLAGVGLMLEFVAHELSRVTQDSLKAVSSNRFTPEVIEAQLKTLEKRVRILDELSIPGRQRRSATNIGELVDILEEFHLAKCERHNIKVEVKTISKRAFSERVERGQILQIIDNLFSNSFYWLTNRYKAVPAGKITIVLDEKQRKILFSDNGPGIPDERADIVFEPMYSTKPPREGRGLGLYIAQRLAEENGAKLYLSEPEKDGMRRTFILEFGV